jgi:hypothetical protein
MVVLAGLMLVAATPAQPACLVSPLWSSQAPKGETSRPHNVIGAASGPVTWNGTPISEELLRQFLKISATIRPKPLLVINATVTDCAHRQHLMAVVEPLYGCTPKTCAIYKVSPGVEPPRPSPPPPPRKR